MTILYQCSRALLILAVLLGLVCVGVLVGLGGGVALVVLGFLTVCFIFRRGNKRSTVLGSAQWATEKHLRRAGMLYACSGLILGRVPAEPRGLRTVLELFNPRLGSKDACDQFWPNRLKTVRLPQAIHSVTIAPTGAGKGVSLIVPFLLTCRESVVVLDFKGELFRQTGGRRAETFGHKIVVLDPYKVVTQTPDTFNPVDFIDVNGRHTIDDCSDLANALVVRTGNEKEPHWNDSAENYISAIATLVAVHGKDGNRSLQTVREILSQPTHLEMAIQSLQEMNNWGALLPQLGGQLLHFVDREKSSVLSSALRHLRFLGTPAIVESTSSSSFDPSELAGGRMTIYLVLPPDRANAQAGLLRMWISSLMRSCIRSGIKEQKVHFVLDEIAVAGHLDAIENALGIGRGYGINLQLYFQSMGQLKKCFPEGQESTLLSNTTQVYFGINENETAEYVSARLGEETIVVESGGTSSGVSHQRGSGLHSSSTTHSKSSNRNWNLQARRLVKPEELMQLSPRTAITFAPGGIPPVCTTLLRWYEEKDLRREPSTFRRAGAAVLTFVRASCLCLFVIIVGAGLTASAIQESRDLQNVQSSEMRTNGGRASRPSYVAPEKEASHVRNSRTAF